MPTSDAETVHELDELFSFVGSKKNEVYVATQVDRTTRCIVGWLVLTERTYETMQPMVDHAPQATAYYSDQFGVYETLVYYPGQHRALPDKSQTYSVEADNAELRPYLARLKRRARCFSRSLHALAHAIKRFVFAWNRRQLYRRAFPNYPAHLRDFV